MMSQLLSPPYPPVLELLPSTAISGLPPDSYIILAVAGARIYHAPLSTKTPDWCYSRMRGTLVFGRDCAPGEHLGYRPPITHEASSYWFRLLDSITGKPLWLFKVSPPFFYEIDRPFFHVIHGKSRRFGFLLDDDDEADMLAKKVIAHACPPRALRHTSIVYDCGLTSSFHL
ncbi:hypothetical protein H0H92_002942 [Tricholoma furcatifolium]|nr:hypothetical protein H0H92_002942 [Tricholoma furcatifolium]